MRVRFWSGQLGMRVQIAVAFAGLLASSVAAGGQGRATAVPQLDVKQFVGSWFEVAHLPDKKQRGCIADALTLFTVVDKPFHFAEVDSCRLKDGTTDARNYSGTTKVKKIWTGKLKVWTIWPFSRKLWVLAVGPEYGWVLLGTPNHKSLAVLSRVTKPDAEAMEQIRRQASAQGFAVAKLVMVSQTSRMAPAAATPLAAPGGGGATPE